MPERHPHKPFSPNRVTQLPTVPYLYRSEVHVLVVEVGAFRQLRKVALGEGQPAEEREAVGDAGRRKGGVEE